MPAWPSHKGPGYRPSDLSRTETSAGFVIASKLAIRNAVAQPLAPPKETINPNGEVVDAGAPPQGGSAEIVVWDESYVDVADDTGSVNSRQGDAFASAVAGIEGQINAQRQAVAASLATINAAITAEGIGVATMESSTGPVTADQSVRMDVLKEVSGGVTSNNGHVYIKATTVKDRACWEIRPQ